MDDLTPEQIQELGRALEELRGKIEQMLEITRDGTRAVDLDEPIGRLTRMDAIQQQGLSAAARSSHDLRLRQVLQSLNSIKRGDYGDCRRCQEPIGYPRLKARPESPYCLECQGEIDRKHG